PRHRPPHRAVLDEPRGSALPCCAVTLVSPAALRLLTPRLYPASTRLEVARQSPIQLRLEGNVLRLGESDRDANGAATFVGMQMAALRSRDLAERVIRGRGLAANDAFLDPRPRRHGLLSLGESMPRPVRP